MDDSDADAEYDNCEALFLAKLKPLIDELQQLAEQNDIPILVGVEYYGDVHTAAYHMSTYQKLREGSDRMVYAMLMLDPEVDIPQLVMQMYEKIIQGKRDRTH